MATTNYLPARGTVSGWGDNCGNRVDRFIAAVAYLDGQQAQHGVRPWLLHPAWYAWPGIGAMVRLPNAGRSTATKAVPMPGQGNHQMTVGDADGDGRDEIFNGSSAINDNGAGYWANGNGPWRCFTYERYEPRPPR